MAVRRVALWICWTAAALIVAIYGIWAISSLSPVPDLVCSLKTKAASHTGGSGSALRAFTVIFPPTSKPCGAAPVTDLPLEACLGSAPPVLFDKLGTDVPEGYSDQCVRPSDAKVLVDRCRVVVLGE